MNDRRVDVVQVSLGGGPVGLPWKSRQDLLAEFRELDSHRSLRDAFEAVGASRPVELTPEQKGELFDTIELWSTRVGYSGLPEGIFELRSALVDDIDAARSATGQN